MGKAVSKVFGGAAKAVSNVVKAVVQPIYNATLKQIPGVDKALVNLDKSVGKAIPGGWGTVASVAASFIPGAQLAAMGMTKTGLATGLGALSGSGVMRKGHEFNLQGAIMGGAMAYGASQLSQGLQEAGKGANAAVEAAKEGSSSGIGSLSPDQLKSLTSGDVGILNQLSAGMEGGAGAGLQAAPEVISGAIPNLTGGTTAAIPGSMAAQNAYEAQGLQEGYQSAFREPSMLDKIGTSIAETPKNVGNFLDKATTGSTYEGLGTSLAETGKGTLSNIADAGAGIKNLVGFGAESGTAEAARSALTNQFGIGSASALTMGASGLMALEEQRKMLDQQRADGTIAQQQYDEAVASIDRQIEFAKQTVAENPFKIDADTAGSTGGSLSGSGQDSPEVYKTLYDRAPSSTQTLYENSPAARYAYGGIVNPADDQTSMENLSPMTNINRQSFARIFPDLGSGFSFGNMQPYQGTQEQEQAAALANQTAGIKTLGDVAKTSAFQSTTGSNPQSYYGNSSSGGGYGGGNQSAFPLEGQYGIVKMAAGGMPRFLSGGGDGMSDSIKASINGTQEARLADGEFVIPADVVSHLGNGSSKAGAKQLYSMMDRVRQARVGNKKQGKQINPRRLMAA